MTRAAGLLTIALVLLLAAGRAAALDPVAVVTELHWDAGQIEVRRGNESGWEPAKPLLALRPGDQIRALGDARAVLVFVGGHGQQVVSAVNSPFSVEVRDEGRLGERVHVVVGRVTEFLTGQQRDLDRVPVASRSVLPPRVVILSPRNTRLLPGHVSFEWSGSESLRYRVRLSGPQGVVWEQANLPRVALTYGGAAPSPASTTAYAWELTASNQSLEVALFEIVSDADARRIREALDLLTPATLPGYSQSTIIVLRAGLLIQERLYADARHELMAGLSADPDEPTLHVLLSKVYEQVGLSELSILELTEARDRLGRRP
jgi:hypothetical protein